MTIKEGIYDIRETINVLNIDSNISNRHIIFLMNTYRAIIVRQFITNNPGEYRDQLTQTLYMELELVDRSQYPDTYLSGVTMLRTVKALPNIIGQQMYKEIEVRTIDRLGTEVEISHKERLVHVNHAPTGFIYGYKDTDGKIYLISNSILYKTLDKITVTCILEDPEKIQDIHDLDTDLDIYPITSHLWGTIKEMVIQQLLKEKSIPLDTVNNNLDDTLPNNTNAEKTQQ